MDSLFLQLGLILVAATLVGLVCHKLKQPLFFAYLVTGIIAGYIGAQRLPSFATLHFLADLGIALLLFLVGLELDVSSMRKLGSSIIVTALGEVLVVGSLGFGLALLCGFSPLSAGYVGLALTFSSTIISVKYINDQHASYALHGRLALGIAMVQDAVALVVLIVLSGLQQHSDGPGWLMVALTVSKGATLIVAHIYLSRNVLPRVFRWMAGSTDLLLLGSIGWCILGAATAQALGFSVEIGAFLAGLGLSSSSYQFQIAAKIKPLRDFFVCLFFIVLGLQMAITNLGSILILTILFSAIVVVITPLTIATILGRCGYKRHTAFFTATILGQTGEFALVLAALGLSSNQLLPSQASLITTTVLTTIITSSYLVKHQQKIYRLVRPYLRWIEQSQTRQTRSSAPTWHDHVIVLGANHLGNEILHMLQRLEAQAVVIEYDPERVETLDRSNVATIFGDATDEEVLEEAGISKARLIVSSMDQHHPNILLLSERAKLAPHVPIILPATTIEEAMEFYRLGASYVILPMLLGSNAVASLVKEHWQNLDDLHLARVLQLQHLAARKAG